MLKVTIEGVYESDIGSGQKKYESFKYEFKTSRLTERGLETHCARRFIPYLIANDKSKKLPFSRVKNFVITDIQYVNDNADCVINKDINELNAWQIQDLASLFDLYEIPAGLTCSISQKREKAILAYLKKIVKIPMNTVKEKEQTDFLVKQPNGAFKLELNGAKVLAQVPEGYMVTKSKEAPKKGLAYFLQNAGLKAANAILNATGNQEAGMNTPDKKENSPFPDGNDLLK